MKNTLMTLFALVLVGCASTPKKEYEWYTPEGQLATPEQVNALKASCGYDKKIEEVGEQIRIGISVGRYDSQYGKKGSSKYAEKASQIAQELHECLRKDGFHTKEKIAP